MRDELRRHAHAVVLHHEFHHPQNAPFGNGGARIAQPFGAHALGLVSVKFRNREPHRPVRLGVFHRIAQQVDEHLAHAHFVAHHQTRTHIAAAHDEIQMLRIGLRTHDRNQHLHQIAHVERRVADVDTPAFDLAHVEHIVHQVQQMMRRKLDLCKRFGHAVPLRCVLDRNVRQTDDGRKRRADVVRYVG